MATTQPTAFPRWNTSGGNRQEPVSGKKDTGWTVDEEPPGSFFNWLQHFGGLWDEWINERADDGDDLGGSNEEDFWLHPPTPAAAGGQLTLSGAAAVTGVGGAVRVIGGMAAAAGAGGSVNIFGGAAVADAGGDINMQGGSADGTDQDAGDVTIVSGFSKGSGSGDIVLGATEGGASGNTTRVPGVYVRCDGSAKAITITRRLDVAGISGDTEPAINADASAGDGPGVVAIAGTNADGTTTTGNGTGSGIAATGGATGYGIEAFADSSSPVRSSLLIGPQDDEPSSPQKGAIICHDKAGKMRIYDGDQWAKIRHLLFTGVNSSSIANTTTETVFGINYTLPANRLAVGDMLFVRGLVIIDNWISGTLRIRVRVGGVTGAQLVSKINSAPNVTTRFAFEACAVVATAGAGGIFNPCGAWIGHVTNVAGSSDFDLENTLSGTDMTASNDIVATAEWSVASPNNSCQLRTFTIEMYG